ncbi:MAG: hypothetical protein LBL42_01410 [Tannerella sp.]|jgi:hypothetical protein|nr:hypothetical protein [Tannerella sp.]
MKQTIATVMVLWMTLSAIQPALAFHFCGGALVSVGLADAERCCCGKETGDDTDCATPDDGIAGPVESCCSNYTVELSTDEFRTTPAACCGEKTPATAPVALPAVRLSGCDVWNDASLIQHLSPPGLPVAGATDLLARICTLRI